MAKVELKHICKTYHGCVHAVKDVTITAESGEFVVFIGPSGCGKSTALRIIAGLEDICSGDLYIDGEHMNHVTPKDRNIAMVFQNYALYPHMNVFDNMAFGLRIRKIPQQEIIRRVHEAARVLDIEPLLARKPKALSGGQRQRVAVGRAIVRNPKVFLFDEPLSNLDAKLRVQMRSEISLLHKRLKATMIYVTHDQMEAMTMADKIVIMKDGCVQQIGSPLHIYQHPANTFVAQFIGSPPMNCFPVTIVKDEHGIKIDAGLFVLRPDIPASFLLKNYIGTQVVFGLRPEAITPRTEETLARECANVIQLKVLAVESLGAETFVYLDAGVQPIVARCNHTLTAHEGTLLTLALDLSKALYFDAETGHALQGGTSQVATVHAPPEISTGE